MWKALTMLFGVVAAAAAAVAVRHLREVPPPPPPMVRAQFPVPADVTLGAGVDVLDAAIAPDEGAVALVASRGGDTALWVRVLADGSTRRLEGTEGAALPAWRGDGAAVAYFAAGRLHVITLATGERAAVADVDTPGGAAWHNDGSLLFGSGTGRGIRRWAAGSVTDVTEPRPGDVAHGHPFVDARGRLLYVALRDNGARVVRIRAEGSAVEEDLTETAGHAELRHDILLHVRDNVLLAQRLSDDGTRLVGRSASLATGVGTAGHGRAAFTSSPRIVLWAPSVPRPHALTWFDAAGTRLGDAAEPADYWQVRLSPDGRRAAVTVLDPLLRTLDVLALPLDAPGNRRRISLSIGPDADPVWSTDGRTIFYRSSQAGTGAIVSRPSGESDDAETVVLRRDQQLAPSDARGDLVLFQVTSDGRTQIGALDRRQGDERAITGAAFSSWGARVSPDGRWVAYVSNESGQPEVYVQAWPSGSPRVRATFGGGERVQWAANDVLVFHRGEVVMRALWNGGTAATVSTPQALFSVRGLRDFAVAPGGARFLVIGAGETSVKPEAHLILDWAPTIPQPPAPPPRL
jgi:Tol biopolymer transport system component